MADIWLGSDGEGSELEIFETKDGRVEFYVNEGSEAAAYSATPSQVAELVAALSTWWGTRAAQIAQGLRSDRA